ncbi:MAG: hypothetical protein ACKO9T_04485 [Nitrospira sp.]
MSAPLRLSLLAAFLMTAACQTGGPPPPIDGPLDGIWTSPHLGYEFIIDGRHGKAIRSSRAEIHKGDVVFEMLALDEPMRFSGRQRLADGTWREFTGELKADGTIDCLAGTSRWVLERR